MANHNKKGWYFTLAFFLALIIFSSFSFYINKSTLENNLSLAMQNNGTKMISYQFSSYHSTNRNQLSLNHIAAKYNEFYMTLYHLFKNGISLGADSIYVVKAANGKQYHVEVAPNHILISTNEVK